MPRKANKNIDELDEIKEKTVKKVSSTKKTSSQNTESNKDAKKSKTPSKKIKNSTEKQTNKQTKKEEKNEKKSKTSTEKKTTTKKITSKTKKNTSLKETKPKKTTTTKVTTSKKQTTRTKQTKNKVEILEYYDLPYRYKQTVVKVLAQTPTTLFVYWDISDEDRNQYSHQYGQYFFHNTKPVLIIHNKTKQYSFEVDINDFANCWYLQVSDANCEYQIELGRRPINEYVTLTNHYLRITNSNPIEAPNDHILVEQLSHLVFFRNIKTNQTIQKDITHLSLLKKIGKLHSIPNFYKTLYPEESFYLNQLDLRNPSSNNPTSSFK